MPPLARLEPVFLDELRARTPLSGLIGRTLPLKRAGAEWKACCPFHHEKTPSFYVNDAKGFYHCFGCSAHGDAIRWLTEQEGLPFLDAVRELAGGAGMERPIAAPRSSAPRRAEPAPARENPRRTEIEAEQLARIAEARELWSTTIVANGSPGETYLRSRGITTWPATVRFAERTPLWIDRETGEIGPLLPALVGIVQDERGELTGVQRIFLRPDGTGKAAVKRAKKSLGRIAGSALRLGGAAPTLHITEGPEDGLSLRQQLGAPVWVTLGTANMPNIVFPDVVRKIVICSQNDDAGDAATDRAALALYAQGYEIDVRHPDPAFKDWNDQLLGRRR